MILDLPIPILKRYFLSQHFFDGAVIGEVHHFSHILSKISDTMMYIRDLSSKSYFYKILNFLFLNKPKVSFHNNSPETILRKAFVNKIVITNTLNEDIFWYPKKKFNFLDTILRYPYGKSKKNVV